jgi:hypothetical protein
MRRLKWIAVVALLTFMVVGCEKPMVAQGTVVSYDANTKQVVIKNEIAPNQEMTFSLEGAEIGAEPIPGDLVRIAYEEQGGQNKAGRLMNLAKQDELKKGGGGGH